MLPDKVKEKSNYKPPFLSRVFIAVGATKNINRIHTLAV